MEVHKNCVVCKESIIAGDDSASLLTSSSHVHRRCFTCSTCGSNLDEKNYKLMENRSLFCHLHGGNTRSASCDFLSTLREFRHRCLSTVSDSIVDFNDLRDEEPNDDTCDFCSNHPFITQKAGYWVECTNNNCPKLPGVLKLTDKLVNSFLDLGSSEKKITKVLPEEIYENYFYGSKHWNYYSREEQIGPVILTIKQEFRHSRDFLRVMVRSSLRVSHGMIPVTDISSSPYGHDEVVQFLSKEIGLESQLKPITLPTATAELLKIDKLRLRHQMGARSNENCKTRPKFPEVFLKDEYKVGIIYMKEDQTTEEQLFNNEEHSKAFDDFLDLLGDRVRLKGFGKYRGGLDTINDLTGTHSVHATYGNKQIMFHVSTLLPFEEKDIQKLQRKRHIGNDIACIVFLEGIHTKFDPECIKSNFLHTFVVVQVDTAVTSHRYSVSVVSRNQVPLYGPSLTEKNSFDKCPEFRRWILNKVINGEIACHKAPNFAKLHQRTRYQLMNDLLDSVEKSSSVEREKREPLPFREHGKWSQSNNSSFQDPFQETFECPDQLAKDFSEALGKQKHLADVRFIVGKNEKKTFLGVKAIMAARSSVFRKLLINDNPPTTETQHKPVPNGINSPTSPRTSVTSWNITGSILPGGPRSRKFSLKKSSRSQSSGEEDVVLSSFSGLDHVLKNGKHGGKEATLPQEFIVEDFEPEEFEALLMYLHTGSCHITAKVLPGLLCAAQRYNLKEIEQVCVDSIELCLDGTTVYTFLQSIEQCTGYPEVQQMLQNKIDVFLQENNLHELDVKATSILSEKSLKLVLSRIAKGNEISKFSAIVEWSKQQSMKMDCCVSIAELAKPLLSNFVDLTDISPDDLMEIVYPSGLVSSDQLMVIMAVKADQTTSSTL